jgi:hypothetical protein
MSTARHILAKVGIWVYKALGRRLSYEFIVGGEAITGQ